MNRSCSLSNTDVNQKPMHVIPDQLILGSLSRKLSLFFEMSFEQSLKGGHPNSLGNTLEVVDAVLGNTDKMEDLFLCYQWKNDFSRKLLKLINLLQNEPKSRF